MFWWVWNVAGNQASGISHTRSGHHGHSYHARVFKSTTLFLRINGTKNKSRIKLLVNVWLIQTLMPAVWWDRFGPATRKCQPQPLRRRMRTVMISSKDVAIETSGGYSHQKLHSGLVQSSISYGKFLHPHDKPADEVSWPIGSKLQPARGSHEIVSVPSQGARFTCISSVPSCQPQTWRVASHW